MPFRALISPYKPASHAASYLADNIHGRALANLTAATSVREHSGEVTCKKIRTGSPFIGAINSGGWGNLSVPTVLIRWGKGSIPTPGVPSVNPKLLALNTKYSLDTFIDKKTFFGSYNNDLEGLLPESFFSADQARAIIASFDPQYDRPILVERNILSGHSGAGIRLLGRNDEPSLNARLWTRYIPKEREFRMHFFKPGSNSGIATFFQEKLKRKATEGAPIPPNTFQVRNWQNGWIYATGHGKPIPPGVREVGIRCAKSFNLDFGAIDLIYNKSRNRAWALEVNTAPGIQGRTAKFYADTILKMIETHAWDEGRTSFKVAPGHAWNAYLAGLIAPQPQPETLELEDDDAEIENEPDIDDNF